MDNKQTVAELLWHAYLGSALGKRVEVSLYPSIRDTIPDKQLIIQDVVPYQEADEVFSRFRPYLVDSGTYPILGTLGGNALCIGISDWNRGTVYYLDFDFGLFELTSIGSFMSDLQSH